METKGNEVRKELKRTHDNKRCARMQVQLGYKVFGPLMCSLVVPHFWGGSIDMLFRQPPQTVMVVRDNPKRHLFKVHKSFYILNSHAKSIHAAFETLW